MLPYIEFLTPERTDEFIHNVRVLFYLAVPLLLIAIATDLGGYLISVIRDVFSWRRNRENDPYDDDDYERD